MLQNLSAEIATCYHKARACQERAAMCRDPAQRQHHLDMERRWMMLARSHEMRERLDSYATEARRRLRAFTPRHPAIPRVMCPECGQNMRLEKIEPSGTPQRRADVVTFTCSCGFDVQQTIDRVD